MRYGRRPGCVVEQRCEKERTRSRVESSETARSMVRGVERGSEIGSNARPYAVLNCAFLTFSRLFQHEDLPQHLRFSRGVCAPYSLWGSVCSTHIAAINPISATHRSSSPVMLAATPLSSQIRAGVAQPDIYALGVNEGNILGKTTPLAKQDTEMASSSSSVGTLERGKACLRCRSVLFLQ